MSVNCFTTSIAAAFMRSMARRSFGFAKFWRFENLVVREEEDVNVSLP